MTHTLIFQPIQVWSTERAFALFLQQGIAATKRTAERRLSDSGFLPLALQSDELLNENQEAIVPSILNSDLARARHKRRLILFCQLKHHDGALFLHANDARGGRYWINLNDGSNPINVEAAFSILQIDLTRPVTIFPHGSLVELCRSFASTPDIEFALLSYPSPLEQIDMPMPSPRSKLASSTELSHLDRLEAESIGILREAVAQADNPAMLYSIGKDSTVMLHLARKAFYPAPPPFPLLHVDTRWKFREMYLFRDDVARNSGMELLVHINPEAIEKNINPFDHGSSVHTDITKTAGLKQALNKYGFDVVFGGARRDEEKSRAKERIFSFRSQGHQWDPKNQRPELWSLYNARKSKDESIRVFPLSNWTELDIWQYIYRESIPIVPLYFAKPRPVVVRDGMIIMVDDARMPLLENEQIEQRMVRFRTLGCYPLTGAIESGATTLPEIILELLDARSSERQGRAIDSDSSGSMEKKKQEGYF